MVDNQLIPLDNKDIISPQDSPVGLYLSSIVPNSRKTMMYALKQVCLTVTNGQSDDIWSCPYWKLSLAEIQLLKNTLASNHSVNTSNLYMASLKGVLKNAWRLGFLSADEYAKKTDIKGVKGSDISKGRSLSKQEISALLGVCDNSLKGCRDRAIVSILIFCGLRRSELSHLKYEDLLEIEYQDKIGYKITIEHGKGHKSRQLFLNNQVFLAINQWLEFRGKQPGFLFPRISQLNDLTKPISSQTVFDTLRDLQLKSGIQHFSPHDLRRTYCTSLLDQGFEILQVSKSMGHSSVSTTQKYDKRSDEGLKTLAFGLTYDVEKIKDTK